MLSQTRLTEKRSGPNAIQVFFDQQIIPALIDTAAVGEAGLERIAAAARRAPLCGLALAAGAGLLLPLAARRRR